MKELDKTKAYDLRDLNDEQLTELLEWLELNDKGWEHYNERDLRKYNVISFRIDVNQWVLHYKGSIELTNALTLFMKIGDTFEYNGYICEVKTDVKRWVHNSMENSYYKTNKLDDIRITVITNQTLIKLLEENAIH